MIDCHSKGFIETQEMGRVRYFLNMAGWWQSVEMAARCFFVFGPFLRANELEAVNDWLAHQICKVAMQSDANSSICMYD
jgi:hypothetical protein